MAVPSADTIKGGATYTRKKAKVRYDIIIALSLVVMLTMVYSILKPTMDAVKQQDKAEVPLQNIDVAKPVETVDSDLLAHEPDFLDTIKSCIPPDKKCGQFIPENNGNRQRIALLAPPGEMSNILWKWIQQVYKRHEQLLGETATHPIEFIRTSHVPPYGYGKTHGLTKIIRPINTPLILGVADALQQIIVEGERNHHNLPDEPLLEQQDITLKDLKAVLRQFMRFHCRLSKVAAHTAILSINLNDFMDNYEEATQQLYEFLKYAPDANDNNNNNNNNNLMEDRMEELNAEMGGGMEEVGMMSAELGFVTQILTRIQATNHVKVLDVLDATLRDEMIKTKNLTNWPCESFYTVGEPHERTTLSLFATKIARSFAPNCSAPFASCWVHRDQCEAAGDGVCKEEK